jgi:hypothetical protein
MGVYTSAWSTYMARRNAALALFFCEVIFVIAAIYAWSDVRTFLVPGVLICAVASFYVFRLWQTWPCPRCGKPFLGGTGSGGVILHLMSIFISLGRTKCPHCGLTKETIVANT